MDVYYRVRKNRASPQTLLLTMKRSKAMWLVDHLEPGWYNAQVHDIWFEMGSLQSGEINWGPLRYPPPGVYTRTYENPGYDVPTLSTFFP